jgi:DNA invertase Pin-like site-specific DNA recombinase
LRHRYFCGGLRETHNVRNETGRKGGRPRKVDDADAAKARQLRDKGITATDIAKMLGVSRATVYRYLADDAAA